MKFKFIKNNNLTVKCIFILGIIIRFIAVLLSNPMYYNHDVGKIGAYGHLDYAIHFYENFKLAPYNTYEFSQPPINAMLQALVMKIVSIFNNFGNDYVKLFECTKVLNFAYSLITLYIVYKILIVLELPKKIINFTLLIFAIYPGYIIMVTQYNNDGISNMFFYISLYFSIKWSKEKNILNIVLLALSIGIGMLTKISVGLVALVTGPMMIIIFIKTLIDYKNKNISTSELRSIIFQIFIFLIVVFPIGLSYSIRNYLLFGQKFNEVTEIAAETAYDLKLYDIDFVDRFLSFPFHRLFGDKTGNYNNSQIYHWLYEEYGGDAGIYHQALEYNIWIDLIKTATFDEYNFKKGLLYGLYTFIYILNIIFFFVGFASMIINCVKIIKTIYISFINKNGDIIKNNILNARIISILLFIIAMSSYIVFNYKYLYSCSSNFRYIPYLLFSLALSISLLRE